MSTLLGLLIAILIVAVPSIIVIWIIGKLHLGLEVDGFGNAILAAFAIAIVAGILTMVVAYAGFMDDTGLVGGIVHLIVSAIVLMILVRWLPGLRVSGFVGALAASMAIGAVYWLGGLLLGAVIT